MASILLIRPLSNQIVSDSSGLSRNLRVSAREVMGMNPVTSVGPADATSSSF
jgi:D-alanyl-D-alanine carboxypeptidase